MLISLWFDMAFARSTLLLNEIDIWNLSSFVQKL